MPSYMIRQLPPGLIGRAKLRARSDDTTLDAVLTRLLTAYAENGLPGTAGGDARTKSLSAERRREIAQEAARSRWLKPTG